MNSSQRVIINTMFLYGNMAVTVIVQLVALRIIWKSLGVVDYGIYTLVAGIVALFAFMNIAMASATQRFLSYEIGKGGSGDVREIFYLSCLLHLVIGVAVVVALEIGGLYYIDNILSAPPERQSAARLLLQCITASTFVNIITVPYEADINANENMGAIAAINILDSLMKLATACYVYYTGFDKLVVYGVLTMSCLIVTLIIKRIYCLAHYPESHVRIHRVGDYGQMKNIAMFAVWNFIGAGSGVARYQGTAVIINRFLGIIVNAEYGVAQQVNGLLAFLANTIVRAVRPQIVKSEGSGDRARMLRLSATTCKITSLMVALIAVPLYVEIPFVLYLWLGPDVTEGTIMFCRAFLIIVFVNQLTIGLQIAIESAGRIRMLQAIVGSMHLLTLPCGYVCLKMGLPAESIMACIIAEEFLAIFVRAAIAKRLVGMDWRVILWHNVCPCLLLVSVCLSVARLTSSLFCPGWLELVSVTAISTLLLCSSSYLIILTDAERRAIQGFLASARAALTAGRKK